MKTILSLFRRIAFLILIAASTVNVSAQTPLIYNQVIADGDDDVEEDLIGGSIDLSGTDLEFVTDGNDQAIGMRFTNISIPQGATIVSAYIQFQVDEITTSGNVDVAFLIEDNVNPASYISSTNNVTGRIYSSVDTIIWNIGAWPTVGTSGVDQKSPNLSNLVQEIVNKPTWAPGNTLAFQAIDPSYLGIAGYTGNTGKRTAESYNGTSAPELIIEYHNPTHYVNGLFPIQKGALWKYNDSGANLGTAWTALSYNDSSWAFGNAILGYANPNITTVGFGLNSNDKHITTYFRHLFDGARTTMLDSLVFNVLRDDGVIIYINGLEAFRSNMPSGNVGFDTLALSAVGGSDETIYSRYVVNNTLTAGLNVIAVELHQSSASSSDLSFDLEVSSKLPPLTISNYPIYREDVWSYLDNGANLTSTNWKDFNYNDSNWVFGAAPLGYSNSVSTSISFGPTSSNKYITTYFRKRINVSNFSNLSDSLILYLKRDDGAVVYINGSEIVRSNMPSGIINHQTKASSAVGGTDEEMFFKTTISKNVLQQGNNIVAVEIHQRDSTSSDLSFDLELLDLPVSRNACSGINDLHISCYTSLIPSSQSPDFIIPSTHSFQVLLKQGDSYTNQTIRNTVPGNNDFTGYIGKSGSSTNGIVGINHENTPGGVSIIDIQYNDTTRLWTVDSSEAVDFYNNDLISTTRNCSGGITPWGTLITSEETTNAGDANSDGYEDVGWQIEIDPISRKVKEYGTPGKQEKLWALGRMAHENIAVANDSITAYEGEDRSSGCVYKFIANNKMNLSSGTLYALKLDSGLLHGEAVTPTGIWIPIPNTSQADRNNTNTLALSLGATPMNGVEDVEISPLDGKIYFTSKGHGKVYRFSDDNDSTLSQFETFVGGQNYLINHGNNILSEPWSTGNDNLCFDNIGNLYVLQDGSRDHIWMVGPSHTQANPKIDIFAKLPIGSEACGMTFTPDYKFMFLSIQHPSSSNSSSTQVDAAGDSVDMTVSTTLVIARKENLGSYSPSLPVSNVSFNSTSCDTFNLSFNSGSGTGYLVLIKEQFAINVSPTDGVSYNASAFLGSGDNLGQNSYAVYSGADTNLTIRGLQHNTKYHISIFNYNENPNKFYSRNSISDSVLTTAVLTDTISGNFFTTPQATEPYSVNNTIGSSYQWSAGTGSIISGQGTNQIQVTWPLIGSQSELKVVETNASGCLGDTVSQFVLYGSVSGLRNSKLEQQVSFSPNPTNGKTRVTIIGKIDPFDLKVYDAIGKEILSVDNLKSTYEIDLSKEKKGTYIIHLSSKNNFIKKVIIVR